MKPNWSNIRKLLCIRPDNMGDLLMSSPAIRAMKATFQCRVTVLTSSAACGIAKHIEEIDEVITTDLPWVKLNSVPDSKSFFELVEKMKAEQFDAAIIFTVYSQNPLPSAMLAYLAAIPRRLAYCRENPYGLLTDWVPEKEPYHFVQHQVRRDLSLVHTIGASAGKEQLIINYPEAAWKNAEKKIVKAGVDLAKPWLIISAGVSEKKRELPSDKWMEAGRRLSSELGYQILLTGSRSEQQLTEQLQQEIGASAFSLAGLLSLEEFISLVDHAPLLISVNSGPVHIAAATGTTVVVLYALTNPQHLPWKVKGRALTYRVPERLRSKNEVIRFVQDHLLFAESEEVAASEIVDAAGELLNGSGEWFPEMLPLKNYEESSSTVSW